MTDRATYASIEDVEAGFRPLEEDEVQLCISLLKEAAIVIDAYNRDASSDNKMLVSCRMVRRQLGTGEDGAQFPVGSTQGTMSAMGYSQSWTMGSGSTGELYISKLEKKLLGVGDKIGARSPVEGLTDDPWN